MLKNSLFAILTVLCAFLLIEGATRVLFSTKNLANETKQTGSRDPALKKNDLKTIFTFGASTVEGRFVEGEVTFQQILEDLFEENGAQARVVNYGVSGSSSLDVRLRIREELSKKPDLIVVYIGHNEFLPGSIPIVKRLGLLAKTNLFLQDHSEFYRFLSRLFREKNRDVLWEKKITFIPPESEVRSAVLTRYRSNLEAIIELAEKRGIPVLISTVFGNERDWSPGASAFSIPEDSPGKKKWLAHMNESRAKMLEKNFEASLAMLKQAEAIDSTHALLNYYIAKNYDQLQQKQLAQNYYKRAIAFDTIPWRALPEVNQIIRDLCAKKDCLFDLEEDLRVHAKDGILGFDLLDDNCHPNLYGKYLIATSLYNQIIEKDLLALEGKAKEQGSFTRALKILKPHELKPEAQQELLNTILRYIEAFPVHKQYLAYKVSEQMLALGHRIVPIEPSAPLTRSQKWFYELFPPTPSGTVRLLKALEDTQREL